MVTTEEFLSQHPEHESSSEHDLTIARINDEHIARQQLEEQRQTLQKRKDALIRETTAKKDELGKLDIEIEKWLAGESNVRKIFEARDQKLQQIADKS
jgi:THO complex subunit 5